MTLQNKITLIERAINMSKHCDLPEWIYRIEGLSSPRSQTFLSIIAKDLNVLEIGTFCGASTVSLAQNAKSVITVDNWNDVEVLSVDKTLRQNIKNPEKNFKKNSYSCTNINSITGDIFSGDMFNTLKTQNFDIIFYDGPHNAENIFTFILLYENIIKNSILIIDDYNFNSVKSGIKLGFENSNITPIKKWLIDTGKESKSDFWNGISIFVFE